MNNRFKKSFSTMMLAALVTSGAAAPIRCTPTHTSMMGSVMRNGSALALNLAGMLCTGLKYSLYAGLGLTSAASYTARKVTDSKIALGVLGVTGTYYGFYVWYLKDFFAIEKKYKPIFETDPTKQNNSDNARLIRFVNEHYYDKTAEQIMQNASTLLGQASAQKFVDSLNMLETNILQDLSKVSPDTATFVKEKIAKKLYNNGVYALNKKLEIEQEAEIVSYLNNAWTGSLGKSGPVMFQLVFPHYYRLNLLCWRLSTTRAHIIEMRETLCNKANKDIKINYHSFV